MMRKIFITAIALLVSVSAYAVDLKLKGGMNVEGAYESNYALASDDVYADMYYSQSLKITADLVISEDTSITTRLDIYTNNEDDVVWGNDEKRFLTGYSNDDFGASRSLLAAKRAYMTHTFPTKTTLKLGLMDGSQWAYDFGNDKSGRWRVFVQQETPFGHVFGVLEKYADQGQSLDGGYDEDAEADDYDIYYLAAITKLADIVFVKPLFAYGRIGNLGDFDSTYAAMPNNGEVDGTLLAFDLGLDGTLEDLGIGFEFEFVYKNLSATSEFKDFTGLDPDDITTTGVYLNGWMNIEPAKVGMWFAWGSYDEDTGVGYDFDDDFDSTTILGDDLGFGGGDDLTGMTAIQIYADVTIPSLEKLTVSPAFTYVMSNQKDNALEDASAFELDIDCSYAITDALSYNAGLGYASVSYDEGDDPDGVVKLYHNFDISF